MNEGRGGAGAWGGFTAHGGAEHGACRANPGRAGMLSMQASNDYEGAPPHIQRAEVVQWLDTSWTAGKGSSYVMVCGKVDSCLSSIDLQLL